jgi:hypothetical protein
MAEQSSWYQANIRQKLGLVWRNRKKISQIIKDYFYLPFFLLIILWSILCLTRRSVPSTSYFELRLPGASALFLLVASTLFLQSAQPNYTYTSTNRSFKVQLVLCCSTSSVLQILHTRTLAFRASAETLLFEVWRDRPPGCRALNSVPCLASMQAH